MSGFGNYFVEFGEFEFIGVEVVVDFGFEVGVIYFVLLLYSGSCGMGVVVVGYYSK